MITLQPDPKEIIIFCDHLAVMCSKYESSRKTPKELITDFFQDIALKEIEYNENYTKKELCIFAEYYDISKRKKNKSELIQDIILYENNPDNYEVVEKRKLMWYFLNELTNDRYFKKYIIYN